MPSPIQFRSQSIYSGRRPAVPSSWAVRPLMGQFGHLRSLASERPSAIMCCEREHGDCHRQVIEERLERDGFKIVHLGESQLHCPTKCHRHKS